MDLKNYQRQIYPSRDAFNANNRTEHQKFIFRHIFMLCSIPPALHWQKTDKNHILNTEIASSLSRSLHPSFSLCSQQ